MFSISKKPLAYWKITPDQGFTLFHIIGKFLYKRKSTCILEVREFWSGDLSYFNMLLHYNCVQALPNISLAADVLDSFSSSDILSASENTELSLAPSRHVSAVVSHTQNKRRLRFTMPSQQAIYNRTFKRAFY